MLIIYPSSQGACANCGDFFGFTICNKEDKVVDWTRTYDVPKNMSSSDLDEPAEPSVKIPLPYTSHSQQSVYSYGRTKSNKDGISSSTEHSETEFNEPYRQS